MSKPDHLKGRKRPALYYIATVVMILSLLGFLYFVGKNVIPYFQATKLEHEIPKPQFNASVQAPVTFSVLSAQAVVSPAPKAEETDPNAEPVKPVITAEAESKKEEAPEEEEPVSVETKPDRPLTKAEERVQALLKEAEEKAFTKKSGEQVYEEWYRRLWDYIGCYLIDTQNGSWWQELDPQQHPSTEIWSGKPDLYHAWQLTQISRLPLTPMIGLSIKHGHHQR